MVKIDKKIYKICAILRIDIIQVEMILYKHRQEKKQKRKNGIKKQITNKFIQQKTKIGQL